MQHLTTGSRDPLSTEATCRQAPIGQAGVTLIELLIVVILVAALMSIGVPSYRYVTTSNRMATEINSFLGDLQYARSEAAREGQYVTVCVAQSTNPASPSCAASGTATWQNGWIIFGDVNNDATVDANDPVLRIQNAFSSGDTLVSSPATSAVTFNRDGFAHLGNASITVTLHDSAANSLYSRCLDVSQAGMMTTRTNTSNPSCT
ncbi:MAG TPA: GspH/FimT family pseudopilin [Steroidobacteraceae bacterium]|nr:GspH/FimT family pseudopilin [Steroidobacteraceae bacterium]